MTVPSCPVHHAPMKLGRKGYYCSRKMDDGAYCTATAPGPSPDPAPSPATAPAGDSLAAAALQFAGSVYQGHGDNGAEGAIQLALEALKHMKAVS